MPRPRRPFPSRRPSPFTAALAAAAIACSLAAAEAAPARPLIAVVAANDGTETTDFLVPFGVLSASGVGDVVAVSTRPGPVRLMPALTVEAQSTVAAFDAEHPRGADLVVVPAVHDKGDPVLVDWVRRQAERGASVAAICDGAWVVAAAGLVDDRTATGHWYSLAELREDYPKTRWVNDRRFVRDGTVLTTAGVTASLPASLALVEELGGTPAARDVALQLGVDGWDARHDGTSFALDRHHVATAVRNWLAFWRHERVGIPVADGVDEVALALAADAFARTYRSSALAVAPSPDPVRTRFGLRVVPDAVASQPVDAGEVDRVYALPATPPGRALDATLATLEQVYGRPTADFVALQLEYPRPAATR